MKSWRVPEEKLDRLLENLAAVAGAPFDEWDRDAVMFGLRDTPAGDCYEYQLHGTEAIRLQLARQGTERVVAADANDAVMTVLARIEVISDEELVQATYHAFRNTPRPDWFTRYWHCPECEGHNTLLDSRNWDNLTHHDLRQSWSPLGFMNPEAFRFWLPALLRLALTEDEFGFGEQFHRYLSEPDAATTWGLSDEERRAVVRFLRHLLWWHPEVVGEGRYHRAFEALTHLWDPRFVDELRVNRCCSRSKLE